VLFDPASGVSPVTARVPEHCDILARRLRRRRGDPGSRAGPVRGARGSAHHRARAASLPIPRRRATPAPFSCRAFTAPRRAGSTATHAPSTLAIITVSAAIRKFNGAVLIPLSRARFRGARPRRWAQPGLADRQLCRSWSPGMPCAEALFQVRGHGGEDPTEPARSAP
jgi:hypothetical protein